MAKPLSNTSATGTSTVAETVDHRMPLLPRGKPLFDNIPARAVVIEELAPALGNGVMVVQRPGALGVILVRDGALFEQYCFDGDDHFLGAAALTHIKTFAEAKVSAFAFDPDLIDIAPTLLRGEVLYADLRLSWTSWKELLTDLCDRSSTYVVEVTTPKGRGVVCIRDGKQIATYTDSHRELGQPTLIDALVTGEGGSVLVRREPVAIVAMEPVAAPLNSPVVTPPAPLETPAVPETAMPQPVMNPLVAALTGGAQPPAEAPVMPPASSLVAPMPAAAPVPPPPPAPVAQPAPDESPLSALFGGTPAPQENAPVPAPVAPEMPIPAAAPNGASSPLQELLPELKLIARTRLQRSAARVETVLDTAAQRGQSLDAVFTEIRGLVIRGVMQSTLDQVVSEMGQVAQRKTG